MSEVPVRLSGVERDVLVRLLSVAIKERRVEVRRTEFSREMRHELEDEEKQIEDLLDKLTRAVES